MMLWDHACRTTERAHGQPHADDPRTSASSCTAASVASSSTRREHSSRTSNGGCSGSGSRSSSSEAVPGSAESDNGTATGTAASSSGSSIGSYPKGQRAALGKPTATGTALQDVAAEPGVGELLEPELLLWRRFRLTQYLSAVSPAWRRLVGMFEYTVVARPSNDPSLGLQGWRSGLLDRWELKFPVLAIFDAPGRAAPGEGFQEWPLFDIFKIDLRGLHSWADYLASLRRADRWNVKTRTKLFQSFESEARLACQVVRLGPEAFGPRPQPQPPMSAPAAPVVTSRTCEPKACRPGAAYYPSFEPQRPAVVCEPVPGPAGARNAEAAAFEPHRGRFWLPQVPVRPQEDATFDPLDDQLPLDQEPEPEQQQSTGLPPPPPPPEEQQHQLQGQTRSQRKKQRKQQKLAQEQQLQQQRQQQQQAVTLKHGKKQSDCASGGEAPTPPPPQLSFVTPGSVAEAEALLGQMWGLYEQTGARNGFTECCREQFQRLVREAPGVMAVVVREGGSGSGPLLAFGLVLPQRESLQVLYIGIEYDNPLVRQSSCYFQILSVGLQVALVHNEAVRQRRAAAAVAVAVAAAAKACPAPATVSRTTSAAEAHQLPPVAARRFAAASGDRAIPAFADGTCAGVVAASSPPPPPPPPALGPRVGLIDFLDLGPGRRFVKEHLGAVGHPVSMYTRGIGPIAQRMSRRLLARHFSPKEYVNDP